MKIVTPLLAVVLGSVLLAQQGMPADRLSRGPRLEALKSYLSLSEQQVETLSAVQRSLTEATRSIHEQIASKQKELREEMAKSEPSASVAGQLMADTKALRSQIDTKRDEFRTQTRAVLNDQQKAALSALETALSLQQAARQAVAINLLEAPEGSEPGPGGLGRLSGLGGLPGPALRR
jgi:chromosome segregation ATPase